MMPMSVWLQPASDDRSWERSHPGGMLLHPGDIYIVGQIHVQGQERRIAQRRSSPRVMEPVNLRMPVRKRIPGGLAVVAGGIVNDLPFGVRVRSVPPVIDAVLASVQEHKHIHWRFNLG